MESNGKMRTLCIAAVLFLTAGVLTLTRRPTDPVWVHAVAPGKGPARILRFYASSGAALPGQTVRLCYAVENARSVKISPMLPGFYPARNYCLEVAPEHTTHFTLWAEGYDGSVAAKSFTLPVQIVEPPEPVRAVSIAGF
jgi:hypothetical protein